MTRNMAREAIQFARERITLAICAWIGFCVLFVGTSGLVVMALGKVPFSFWIASRLLAAVVVGALFLLPATLAVVFRRRNSK
jgi:cytochrome c oxidase assembly factor CtaG